MYASKPVKQKTAALGTSYIHDIELFHLKRTSAVRRSQCGKKVSSQKPDYYLFDYYDSLSYLQDAQSVEDFLGISDSDHDPSAIASQYQALIDVQGGMRKGGLFVQSEMDQTLPFIAVVSITILPKATSQDRKDTGTADSDASHAEGTGTEANTEQFLQDCVAEINDILEAGIQSFALDGENIAYKTYLCLNSGNFCIVMRSNSPELSYRLTMHLRSCCLNPEQHNGFPLI